MFFGIIRNIAKEQDNTPSLGEVTEDFPEGVSGWFVYCAQIGLEKGHTLKELRQSFLDAQSGAAEKVNKTFDWLEEQLGR